MSNGPFGTPGIEEIFAKVKASIETKSDADKLRAVNALIKADSAFFPGKELASRIVLERPVAVKATTTFYKAEPVEAIEVPGYEVASAPKSLFDPKVAQKFIQDLPKWEQMKTPTKIGIWAGIAAVGGGILYFTMRKKKR